jgi:excisionase family DNA binding protein
MTVSLVGKTVMVDRRFYTPREVANMLGVSTTTVLKLIHDGTLPAIRVSERIYRIPIPAFERFQAGAAVPAFTPVLRRVERLEPLGAGEDLPHPTESLVDATR